MEVRSHSVKDGSAIAFWGQMEVRSHLGKDEGAIAFWERWECDRILGKMEVRSHSGKDGSAIAFWERWKCDRILGKMEVRSHFGEDGSAIAAKAVYNRLKIKSISIESMPTYNEVLNQVQSLPISEQLRLSEELKNLLDLGVEVEGDEEMIPVEEITESEAAWQDYVAGRDRGNSLKEIELELFGRELD